MNRLTATISVFLMILLATLVQGQDLSLLNGEWQLPGHASKESPAEYSYAMGDIADYVAIAFDSDLEMGEMSVYENGKAKSCQIRKGSGARSIQFVYTDGTTLKGEITQLDAVEFTVVFEENGSISNYKRKVPHFLAEADFTKYIQSELKNRKVGSIYYAFDTDIDDNYVELKQLVKQFGIELSENKFKYNEYSQLGTNYPFVGWRWADEENVSKFCIELQYAEVKKNNWRIKKMRFLSYDEKIKSFSFPGGAIDISREVPAIPPPPPPPPPGFPGRG